MQMLPTALEREDFVMKKRMAGGCGPGDETLKSSRETVTKYLA
jgi:hypothetical protein